MDEQSFSIADVQRLQDQLIEKTQQIYELQETCKRVAAELADERSRRHQESQRVAPLYAKGGLQGLLKGKNSRSVDVLEQEVCKKLVEQEAEFKLQTETLLRECQRLSRLNETLQAGQPSGPSLAVKDSVDQNATGLDETLAASEAEVDSLKRDLTLKTKELEELQSSVELCGAESASLQSELQRLNAKVCESQEQLEMVQLQLQESLSANDCLSSQVELGRTDVAQMQERMREFEAIAEERKVLLASMAERLEEMRRDKEATVAQLKAEAEQLRSQWTRQLEAGRRDLQSVEQLNAQLKSLEATLKQVQDDNCQLKQTLQNAEDRHTVVVKEKEAEMARLSTESVATVRAAARDYQNQIEALQSEIVNLKILVEQQGSLGANATQQVEDMRNEMKSVEKKHKAAVKDLKKQLAVETRRADRLQEKLLQTASEEVGTSRTQESDESHHHRLDLDKVQLSVGRDTNSISSWSLVSKENSRDSVERRPASNPQAANGDSLSCTSEVTTLELENEDLIRKLADLQKDKWELEEKLHHVSSSPVVTKGRTASMHGALDAQQPTIPNLSHDNWTPVVRKLFDLLGSHQTSADMMDMNKRLQLLLEETLTKNIHLTQDLEILSTEVQRLSDELERSRVE